MSAAQKAQSPGATGQSANENIDDTIVGPKPEATLIAEFALAGHAVHRLAEGGYLVCKHGHAKHCQNLHSLVAFAHQVGVRS
jgi:hypothetical protein